MLKKHNQLFLSILFFSDLIVVAVSWVLAYYLRFYYIKIIPVTKGIPPFDGYVFLLLFILVISGGIFRYFKLYIPRRHSLNVDEFFCIVKSTLAIIILTGFITFFYRNYSYSRVVMVYFFFVNVFLMTTVRGIIRKILKYFRKKGYNIRRIVIIGTGEAGESFYEKINSHPEMGFRVEGFVDDTIRKNTPEIRKKYLGTIDEISNILKKHKVDQIYIALPLSDYNTLLRVMGILKDEMVDVIIIPDLYQFITLNAGVEDFMGLPIINITRSPLYGWNSILKRLLDLSISIVAVIVLHTIIPLMPIIYLITFITSGRPIFYKQERMSLDGRRFIVYKIRTMVVDAEAETGAVWAVPNDKRSTKFGRILRRLSLDELPQLFNVIKGDMSLVGPRPERPVFVNEFKKTIPKYMLRHRIKAGCTGWAQVNGWRGNTSLEKRIEYDLYYLENWSLSFDLKILWLTLWKGFINKNAY
ncbi:MAG: undecaprenyl-phosphate glucose phosphotransferase [Candidatus Schekmanbacteria bacterium]|nr:MAG: undecaprenyl-phosphate glucose phosphotransferase [Candidatus Schekmanbacteria bacterium]